MLSRNRVRKLEKSQRYTPKRKEIYTVFQDKNKKVMRIVGLGYFPFQEGEEILKSKENATIVRFNFLR